MKICVFGGAGYVGSHFCHMARKSGHEVVIFDNFSTGHRFATEGFAVAEGDICDPLAVDSVLSQGFDAVCHFAGKISVEESMEWPDVYWEVNVEGSKNILSGLDKFGINNLVFSSTAAVYQVTESYRELSETNYLEPVSVYGKTKLAVEKLMAEWAVGDNCRQATVFRYFNAAGAGIDFGLGEAHYPETHLIPNAIYAGLGRSMEPLHIFGSDYETIDGTCLRDFVHVLDIASAHLLALQDCYELFRVFNLGSGHGFTVNQVVSECERQLAQVIPKRFAQRRDGDSPILVASSTLAHRDLQWRPVYSDLEMIISSAIQWHRDIQPEVFL